VVVDKGDLQLSAALLSSDGQTLSEHLGQRFGPLRFSHVAAGAGVAYLRLRSMEEEAGARRYALTVESLRGAAARDEAAAAASDAYAEAEALRAKWDGASLRAAADRYATALAYAMRAGDSDLAALSLRGTGDCHFILSEFHESLAAYEQALAFSRSRGDGAAELDALNDSGYACIYLGKNDAALRQSALALSLLAARADEHGAESRRQKARALNTAGEVYYSLSELRKALDYFEQARAAWAEAGDRAGEALARLNLGYTHTDLGDLKSASEQYDRALALWQAVGDNRGEALTLTAIGGLQSFLGEKQSALDYHGRALRVFQALGNYQGEAATWNGIAQVYEDSGQSRVALNCYETALRLYEQVGNRDFAALTMFYVGRSRQAIGEPDAALDYYLRSARLSRAVGNRQFEAHALKGAGTVYESRGQGSLSLKRYAAALKLYKRIGDRRWQARTLNCIGHVHDASGDKPRALIYYGRALSLSRRVEDRREEVTALYNLARAEHDLGRLDEALDHILPAVGLVDSLRLKVAGEELRNSYFASVHQLYELYIDLLMQAHKRQPDAGFAAAALQASERGRARSLFERLEWQKAEGAASPAPDLLVRERALWQQLDFKLESQTRLLNRQHTEAEAEDGAHEIQELTAAYQNVLELIQRQNPVYATLTQPQLLRAEAIRAEARDDTVLLEYSLGDQRSFLWAVTPGAIEAYELPPRATVEALTEEVYELLTARQSSENEPAGEYRRRVESSEAQYPQRAAELSRMLLGQVASRIEGKRLLIACDGALHHIPFDALPEPSGAIGDTQADYVPLVLKHEIVTIPSASVLSALRGAQTAEASPQRLIAVIADPVFDREDSRVHAADDAQGAGQTAEPGSRELPRETGDAGGGNPLPRLVSSLREAEAIADLTSARERSIFTGFDADLGRVTGGQLAEFRIVHFATHALFDDEHPESSGLVFSRIDERGRRREGFLKVNDIYGLHLNADLVVLSACRTGLGRHINGEGLLGITRGFMYAGSRGVVASLWKVNDEATAELMKQFYGAMLRDGLAPSAALRTAKEAVSKQERWRSPYFWAAFIMQGGCDRALATAKRPRDSAAQSTAALSLFALALAALITFRAARRVFWRT
jgi:CHAT domain-containing protein